MNFRKTSKRGAVISDQKNYVALFQQRESATGTDFPDKSATFFSENRVGGGGGSEAVWKFSENLSNLVQVVFPYLGEIFDRVQLVPFSLLS